MTDKSFPAHSSRPAVLSGAPGSLLTTPPQSTALPQPDHLTVLSPLGAGGMGEVFRAYDERLHRQVALKVLRRELADHPPSVERFLAEAQATAQLEHPGIVPVHEIGRLPDGRPYFTMREVRGTTLRQVLTAHRAGQGDWTARRLLLVLGRICEAVAYAHDRGVLHRDLKPDNIMVGDFGQVFVMDWGLVQIGRPEEASDIPEPIITDTAIQTRLGTLIGTPRYLAPEQRAGQPPSLASDVYALGLLLWEVLSPLPPGDPHPATAAVETGQPIPLPPTTPPPLRTICADALALKPERRFPTGSAMAASLQEWLTGEAQRQRALGIVAEADALIARQAQRQDNAEQAAASARTLLSGVHPWNPVDHKRNGWAAEDTATRLYAEAAALQRQRVQLLQAALTHAPELPEALAALAEHHRQQQAHAEQQQQQTQAQQHAEQLEHYDRGHHAAWRAGTGTITLHTDPPGAEVIRCRYVERDRVLCVEAVEMLGTTPLQAVPIPMGRWMLRLRAEGCDEVRYPVVIGRQEHWHGTPPGHSSPSPVPLPRSGMVSDGECYVPPGWFWSGTPDTGFQSWPSQRRWIGGLLVQRYPVTNRQFLSFIRDIDSHGQDPRQWIPRERGTPGDPCYQRINGQYEMIPDADGDTWDPDWPVFLIDWHAAQAYAAWLTQRTGQPWRLPEESEWEKAARGTDQRTYPWGDRLDPTFTCIRESHPGRPLPARVTDFPADVSVYGVRGMAGNVREWCVDRFKAADSDAPTADHRVLRGGCWFFPARGAHLAARFALGENHRGDTVGVRLVRSWPE